MPPAVIVCLALFIVSTLASLILLMARVHRLEDAVCALYVPLPPPVSNPPAWRPGMSAEAAMAAAHDAAPDLFAEARRNRKIATEVDADGDPFDFAGENGPTEKD